MISGLFYAEVAWHEYSECSRALTLLKVFLIYWISPFVMQKVSGLSVFEHFYMNCCKFNAVNILIRCRVRGLTGHSLTGRVLLLRNFSVAVSVVPTFYFSFQYSI